MESTMPRKRKVGVHYVKQTHATHSLEDENFRTRKRNVTLVHFS